MSNGYFQGLWDDDISEERLPNGYTRKDYYDYGFTDFDLEYWGMDKPGAPGNRPRARPHRTTAP